MSNDSGKMDAKSIGKKETVNVGLTLPTSALEQLKVLHLATSILVNDAYDVILRQVFVLSFKDFLNAVLQSMRNNVLDNVSLSPVNETRFYSLRISTEIKEKIERTIEKKKFFFGENKYPDFNRVVRYKLLSCVSRIGAYRILSYVWFIKLIFNLLKEEYDSTLFEKMLLDGEIPVLPELYSACYDVMIHYRNHPEKLNEPDDKVVAEIAVRIGGYLDKIHMENEAKKKMEDKGYVPKRRGDYDSRWIEAILSDSRLEVDIMPVILGDGNYLEIAPIFFGPIGGITQLYKESYKGNFSGFSDDVRYYIYGIVIETIEDVGNLKEYNNKQNRP